MKSLFRIPSALWSVLLGALALVVYIVTMSRGPFPGESATLIAYHTGLDPFDTMLQPVWGLFVRLLAILPAGDLAWRLNLFSAICAALSVALLFQIVSDIPHNKSLEENRSDFPGYRAQAVSGIVAALFFAFCVPLWTAATRAHYLTFDALLLLICTRVLMTTWTPEEVRSRRLFAFALLYGIGMVESTAFILAAPAYGIFILFRLWRDGVLNLRLVLRMIAWGGAGLLIILPTALRYYFTSSYEWREMDGFHHLLWVIIRDHGRVAISSARQLGWMLLLLTTVAPWFVVMTSIQNPTADRSSRIGSLLMHGVVTLLAAALLLNLPPAPMAVLADGIHLTLPYLVAAIWIGYIAGYWYALSYNRKPYDTTVSRWRKPIRVVWLLLLATGLAGAAWQNAPLADGRPSRMANIFAEGVLDGMGDRTWLVSNGALDSNLRILAARRGRELIIINPRLGGMPPYRRYLKSLFEDDMRRRGLAQLGPGPLLSDWLQTDPDIDQQLAVLAMPDLWVEAGFYPQPDHAVFLGTRRDRMEPDPEFLDRNLGFWAALQAFPPVPEDHPAHRFNGWMRSHASRVANNTGVYLEDVGRSEEALNCYVAARELDPENISALLNQLNVVARLNRPELTALQEKLETLLAGREGKLNLWALSANYGYVRDPQAFVSQGLTWAMSGRIRSAVAEIERAAGLAGMDPRLQHLLGELYVRGDRAQEGEAIYQEILAANPDDPMALLNLARLALTTGRLDDAESYLDRIRGLDVPFHQWAVEHVMLDILEGKTDAAREQLGRHLRDHPRDARAWGLQLFLARQDGDEEQIDKVLVEMRRAAGSDPNILLVVAQTEMERGRLQAARDLLSRLRDAHPGHIAVLEQLLRLDVAEVNQESARRHVERLLGLDPGNALGNYILGSLQIAQRDFALAEQSLRRSLERNQMPEAMNDLAWLLQDRGELHEAHHWARRALEVQPQNPNAWSTLGVIQRKLGNLTGAAESLHQALQMRPDHPLIKLNVVELYEEKGLRNEALALLDEVMTAISLLPEDERRRALDLSARLRRP